jgi:hypothetical protein
VEPENFDMWPGSRAESPGQSQRGRAPSDAIKALTNWRSDSAAPFLLSNVTYAANVASPSRTTKPKPTVADVLAVAAPRHQLVDRRPRPRLRSAPFRALASRV